MGSNIVWFDSLPKAKQYNILFEWKKEKYSNKLKSPIKKKVKEQIQPFSRKWAIVLKTIFPPSLKHIIELKRKSHYYRPSIVNIRDTTIDILLKK